MDLEPPQDGPARLYAATFIFAAGAFDEDFHQLDARIAEAARSLPGYLGEESWENAAQGLVSNVYYWATLDDLQALMRHPAHLAAKAAQSRWLRGYQVVVAEVLAGYGDGRLADQLPAAHRRMPPPTRLALGQATPPVPGQSDPIV